MVKGKVIRKIVFECSQRLLCKGLTAGREQQWCFYPKFVGTGKIQLPQFSVLFSLNTAKESCRYILLLILCNIQWVIILDHLWQPISLWQFPCLEKGGNKISKQTLKNTLKHTLEKRVDFLHLTFSYSIFLQWLFLVKSKQSFKAIIFAC